MLTVTAATLLSFVAALVHFTVEVLVYKTMSLKSAANPLVIAGRAHAPRLAIFIAVWVLLLAGIPTLAMREGRACAHYCICGRAIHMLALLAHPHTATACDGGRHLHAVDGGRLELLPQPCG